MCGTDVTAACQQLFGSETKAKQIRETIEVTPRLKFAKAKRERKRKQKSDEERYTFSIRNFCFTLFFPPNCYESKASKIMGMIVKNK